MLFTIYICALKCTKYRTEILRLQGIEQCADNPYQSGEMAVPEDEKDRHRDTATFGTAVWRQGIGHPIQISQCRDLCGHSPEHRDQQAIMSTERVGEGEEAFHLPLRKTYQFFLHVENKELTKIISLTGNDIETSGLLYSAMFCTNQKNAFLICKSSVFIPYSQNYSSEKWRNFTYV